MELRQLRAFVAVARHLSFTRAAEELRVAQPAVSMALRKLEEELELTLLHRVDKRVGLTAEGEVLLVHAERLLDQQQTALAEMAELRGLLRGEVRIGIPPMMSSYYFPQVISAFHRCYPHLRLAVNGEGAARIRRMLLRGELDIGVIAGSKIPDGLQGQRFLREEIVACAPVGHPLAGPSAITLEQFLREPLVMYKEGYTMRELLDEQLRRLKIAPQVVFETNLFSLVRSLIKEGLGLSTFLRMVADSDAELAAISFDPPLYLDLHIAWKEDGYLSRADRAFVEFLLTNSAAVGRGNDA